MTLADPAVTVLGPDPSHRRCVLNGNAFQQDAVQSCNGWQYACFYSSLPDRNSSDNDNVDDSDASEPLFVNLARRKLPHRPWETLVFTDYPQTTDDGHNTIQVGICAGDGTIHLSYDHHCDRVRYRHSASGVATSPEDFQWDAKLFTPTLAHLPGLENENEGELLAYITYPRFGRLGRHDLWYSWRTGKAGLGDDHLAIYRAGTGAYELVGTHLKGVDCNPYIHGLHYRDGRLYTTWVYRAFVWYDGWDDPADAKHKQQAGPNGAENNHDICFAYSDDEGRTWRNGADNLIADLAENRQSILPSSPGIVAFHIPKGSGLINQESQAVDHHGGVHVLNRDNRDGELRWKHYYRCPQGTWTQRALPYVGGTGKRGQLAISKDDDLYLVLPGADTATDTLTILKASKASNYSNYELVWKSKEGAYPPTEPLVDNERLDYDNVLSVYTRRAAATEGKGLEGKGEGKIDVVVLDFDLTRPEGK